MKYLLTIIDPETNSAVDVVYCGRDFEKMRAAGDAARENLAWRGKRIRFLATSDDGREIERHTEHPLP